MVLKAVGQQKQSDWLKKVFPELALNRNGTIARDFDTGQTNLPNVFTGGDCANGGREVVNAVGEGKKAARGIHKFFGETEVVGPIQPSRWGVPAGPFGSGLDAPIRVPELEAKYETASRPPRIPKLGNERTALPATRSSLTMADLSTNLAGIKSPNPFWIASGPPGNTAYQAHRAFEAGWGGVVWKTIGDPIRNVSSRYSSIDYGNQRMAGLNNIELISDRVAGNQLPRNRRGEKTLAQPRCHRLAHGRHARELARLRQALSRLRRRRDRAELRLSPWHVRTRHGLGRWSKSRCRRDHHRLGDGSSRPFR